MSRTVAAMAVDTEGSDGTTELVRRARSGEREAYGELIESYWRELVALARGILAVDGEAEDVVQEALIHAWPRLRTLRRPESFGAWIRRVVARRCLSRARRRRRTLQFEEMPAKTVNPTAGVDAARLLATLAPRQRAALYLTWIEGYTDSEAAAVLGIRAATVRVHRHRGLLNLRQLVEVD